MKFRIGNRAITGYLYCPEKKWMFPLSEKERFRKIVIDCIMSLDVAGHFRRVEELEDPTTTPTHLLRAVIRAADMGFTAMPWESHYSSVERLISEYVSQGDDEWAMGIPVSLYCDSATLDVPGMELGFLEMSTLPLYNAIQKRVDEYNPMSSGRMRKVLRQIESNRRRWEQLVAARQSPQSSGGGGGGSDDDDVVHLDMSSDTGNSASTTTATASPSPESKVAGEPLRLSQVANNDK
ncbi:Calcium/calmodulin-dependent 3',5'-cyclic nucleotide phosphodiesterase 1B, partial [Perkinsus olseni]